MLDKIKHIINSTNCSLRFAWFYDSGIELTAWECNFTFPEKGYVEISSTGPIEIHRIKWIEINPVEEKILGRLIPPKKIFHTKQIIDFLEDKGIEYSFDGELIKIDLKENQ